MFLSDNESHWRIRDVNAWRRNDLSVKTHAFRDRPLLMYKVDIGRNTLQPMGDATADSGDASMNVYFTDMMGWVDRP